MSTFKNILSELLTPKEASKWKDEMHFYSPKRCLHHSFSCNLKIVICRPHSLFFSLPFFWLPRPKPAFFTSPTHFLFLARIFFIPPPCKNFCLSLILRCFRIWALVFSSERTLRPPDPAEVLREVGPRRPRPRPKRMTKSSSKNNAISWCLVAFCMLTGWYLQLLLLFLPLIQNLHHPPCTFSSTLHNWQVVKW